MEKSKVAVQRYNLDYLLGCIMMGSLDASEGIYEFDVCDRTGNKEGMKIKYNINTGYIIKQEGDKITHIGDVSDSIDKVGYVNFLIYTPYYEKVHSARSVSNSYDSEGNPVARQWTVYAHLIGCLVGCVLNKTIPDTSKVYEVNHKDGCKFHNWVSNLELTFKNENTYHGAVLTALLNSRYSKDLGSYTESNKLYEFRCLGFELSAKDVIKYMKVDKRFDSSVKKLAKELTRCSDDDDFSYRMNDVLISTFISYLKKNNKLMIKRRVA